MVSNSPHLPSVYRLVSEDVEKVCSKAWTTAPSEELTENQQDKPNMESCASVHGSAGRVEQNRLRSPAKSESTARQMRFQKFMPPNGQA